MLKYVALFTVLIISLGLAGNVVEADEKVAIVQFTSSLNFASLADVERETLNTQFTWYTSGVTEKHTLDLQVYVAGEWLSTIDTLSLDLPAQGELTVTIQHSQTFAPPTYRLVILDGVVEILDQWVVVIAYESLDTEDINNLPPPVSLIFTAITPDIAASESGIGQANVTWETVNRQPTHDIRFAQLLLDGTQPKLPLLKDGALWIPSSDNHNFDVVLEANATQVFVQAQLVNILDEIVLDQVILAIPILLTGTTSSNPNFSDGSRGGGSGGFVPGSGPPTNVTASITPTQATYGQTVTIQWQLRQATSFKVMVDMGAGNVQIFDTREIVGTFDYNLPTGNYTVAKFTFTMTNDEGISRSRIENVTISN